MTNLMRFFEGLFCVALALIFPAATALCQDRISLLETRIVEAIDATYADALEAFCEQHVFPKSMSYQGADLALDHCITESIDRVGTTYEWVCRAKYSGEVDGYLFSPERVRLEFSGGECRLNQGHLRGSIHAEAASAWMKETEPFQRREFAVPAKLRRYDAAILHPSDQTLHLFLEEFFYTWDPVHNFMSRRMAIHRDGWRGITPCVDAALFHPRLNRIYFFYRDRYTRSTFGPNGQEVDRDGTIAVSGWSRVWTKGIDSALLRNADEIVFFRMDEYRSFNIDADYASRPKKREADPTWSLLPPNRIDASFEYRGKLYFLIQRELFELDESRPGQMRRGQPNDFGWNFR